MFNHTKMRQLISAFVDGELSSPEKQMVGKHIDECPSCKGYFKQLQQLKVSLKEWPSEDPSPDLEQKIKSQLINIKSKEGVKMKTRILAVGLCSGVLVTALMLILVNHVVKPGIQGHLKSATDDIGEQFSPGNTSTLSFTKSVYEGDDVGLQSHPDEFNTEQYNRIYENDFLEVKENPLSTFSIDVDTASYSNIRRFFNSGQMPPKDAVRIEEMINYFTYTYPQPEGNVPFSINTEIAACPWNEEHQLVMVGLQGKKIELDNMPPNNLVFLIDVSGSMDDPQKLPLLQESFKLLVQQLRDEDQISIVVYAGAAGLVLDSTPGSKKQTILDAISRLQAGGSTAGGAGVQLAYKIAKENFISSGNNRVILATDGDFNVGVSSDGDLVRIIEEKRKEGIFLTVLGFGTGNYKDSKMEQLADKGNGNYAYIDDILEAKKVLVSQLGGTLFTIAKDVKLQIEFNPVQIKAYRLIGYENRMLKKEDFNDDKKDAGELGSGHTVTAFYELVPADSVESFAQVDKLRYQQTTVVPSRDILTVKLRYKEPKEEVSKLLSETISDSDFKAEGVSENFQFASAVAEFGLLLRDSEYKANASYAQILRRAKQAVGEDAEGYRFEFVGLVKKAQMLGQEDTAQ